MKQQKKYQRTEYFIPSQKIKKEMKFVVLSDLHGREYPGLADDIAKEKPDAVLVLGDMIVAGKTAFKESMASSQRLFSKLQNICPVFYGNGNHETKVSRKKDVFGEDGSAYREVLDSLQVEVLSNESKKVCIRGNDLLISGLEIDLSYYKKWGKLSMDTSYLEELLGEGGRAEYHILLAHNPHYFDVYAAWGTDLSLSGHLHGGIAGYTKGGGIISPQFKLFPKYAAGMFEMDGKRLVVSRGLGDHHVPIRIHNPREYIVLRIGPEK